MTRRILTYFSLVVAGIVFSTLACGQTLQFRVQQGSLITAAADGSTVTMAADGIGKAAQASVTATYSGTIGASVTDIRLIGSPDFSLTSTTPLPQGISVGQNLNLVLRFQPSTSSKTYAQLAINYVEGQAVKLVTLNLMGTAPEFTVGYILQSDNNFNYLSPGGKLTFPATSINTSSVATLVVTNKGSGMGSVNSISLAGGGFQLVSLPALPMAMDAGKEIRFGAVYAPLQAGSQNGTLSVSFSDRTFTAQVAGTTASPSIKLTYYLQADSNVMALDSGGKLVFPATKVNAVSNAVIAISNYGSGAGYVNGITLTGANFQFSGMSPLPVLLGAGKQIQFGLSYLPASIAGSTGTLQIVLEDRTVTIDISGTASGPVFSYAVVNNGSIGMISAKDTVAMPDTAVNDTSSVVIQIKNTGNADGLISGIGLTGPGFQLSNLPIMPYLLPANATVLFNLQFTPSKPGAANGRLQIGADAFDLIANAKGPGLSYTYTSSGGPVAMLSSRVVQWGNVKIGQTAQATLTVRNDGTSSTSVSTIAIAEGKSAFSFSSLPLTPANLAPGSAFSVPLVFSPLVTGDNVAHLRVDSETFTLLGSGIPPDSLPAITLRGPAQALGPLQQPALGLTLATPYAMPLTGTLTLTVNSNSFSVDPAVQFATGGRTVAFTIPANKTQAQFPTGTDIRIQTGSIASTINVTAALFTSGGIELTRDAPPTLDLKVPTAPPQVLDIQLNSQTANGFVVQVTGLSTSRTLTDLALQFASTANYKFPAGNFTINLNTLSATWYRSAESQNYGSLFSVAVPISLQGLGASVNLSDVIQTVSATLSNEQGRSANLSVAPNQ